MEDRYSSSSSHSQSVSLSCLVESVHMVTLHDSSGSLGSVHCQVTKSIVEYQKVSLKIVLIWWDYLSMSCTTGKPMK